MVEKRIHKMGFELIVNEFKLPGKLEHLVSRVFVDLNTTGKDFRGPSRIHDRIASTCQTEQTLIVWLQARKRI